MGQCTTTTLHACVLAGTCPKHAMNGGTVRGEHALNGATFRACSGRFWCVPFWPQHALWRWSAQNFFQLKCHTCGCTGQAALPHSHMQKGHAMCLGIFFATQARRCTSVPNPPRTCPEHVPRSGQVRHERRHRSWQVQGKFLPGFWPSHGQRLWRVAACCLWAWRMAYRGGRG